MKRDHIKNRLDDFLFGETSKGNRQSIAEHLLVCDECRREHDELKLGASLLSKLPAADAPSSVWANIQDKLDSRGMPTMGLIPQVACLDWRKGFAFAVSLIAVSTIAVIAYISLFTGVPPIAHGPKDPAETVQPPVNSDSSVPVFTPNVQPNPNFITNVNVAPQNSNSVPETVTVPSWQVETLAGMPIIGNGGSANQIAVGQLLETDGKSKAKITVANIGSVEVEPNSRVKFVGTGTDQHRLALERGGLHAKILAPPRLFVVDTPSGQAVDLGCEYTLQVDRVGNSVLRVTSGFVALEDKGRESIVPAGMMSLTRKGRGIGTPFRPEADAEFRRALEQFDFAGGGRAALQTLLARVDFYDMITLWHLLSRAPKEERAAVFDQLAKFVAPAAGVTRQGILELDKKMLAAWRAEVENTWFS